MKYIILSSILFVLCSSCSTLPQAKSPSLIGKWCHINQLPVIEELIKKGKLSPKDNKSYIVFNFLENSKFRNDFNLLMPKKDQNQNWKSFREKTSGSGQYTVDGRTLTLIDDKNGKKDFIEFSMSGSELTIDYSDLSSSSSNKKSKLTLKRCS